MLKFLLLLALVVWLWYSPAVRRLWRKPAAKPPETTTPPSPGPSATSQPGLTDPPHGLMVRCSHCGLHLPQADALPGPDGQHYCCEAHRAAGPAQGATPGSGPHG